MVLLLGKLTKPLIDIPNQKSPSERLNKKTTKLTIDKLTLSKDLILTHMLNLLDEIIDVLTKVIM